MEIIRTCISKQKKTYGHRLIVVTDSLQFDTPLTNAINGINLHNYKIKSISNTATSNLYTAIILYGAKEEDDNGFDLPIKS